jgi:hypothetical protein
LREADGKIHLLVDDELRWIVDEGVFRQLGFTTDEVIPVQNSELAYYSVGAPITVASLDPLGSLLQDPQTYGIYFAKDGVKYPLMAPELLTLNFPQLRVRKATADELNRYQKGPAVRLKDGLLIKVADNATVYVMANGRRIPIASEQAFNALGYKWSAIQTVSKTLLELHEHGDALEVAAPLSDEEAANLIEENT